MNILLVSSYLPFPLHSGGQVRLYNLIKELSLRHKITLICEKRPHQTAQDVKEVEKFCKKVITVNRRKQWSVGNVIKSGTSSHSFLVTGHTSSEMQAKIREALAANKFDVIHCETFYVMQNIPQTTVPTVLAEHNIEYLVYKKFVDRALLPLRPLLQLDIKKIKRDEEQSWFQATKVVAVSEEDKKVIAKQGITATIVANGVDTDLFTFKDYKQSDVKKILFIGDFKWIQNRDSAKFIIEEIWPKIKKQNLGVKLWIVGRSIPDSLRNLTNDANVLFDETSSSKPTHEIFQEATVLLAPIRVGGGTSYKILESMACGTPVVTMPLSAASLGVTDGQEIMIGNTPQELAKKTMELVQDEKVYKSIAEKGRIVIEEKYTWKEIGKNLEYVYTAIVSER